MKTISFIVCYIVTFYRLILLIDIFICLAVTAVCLFFIVVLQQQRCCVLLNCLNFSALFLHHLIAMAPGSL